MRRNKRIFTLNWSKNFTEHRPMDFFLLNICHVIMLYCSPFIYRTALNECTQQMGWGLNRLVVFKLKMQDLALKYFVFLQFEIFIFNPQEVAGVYFRKVQFIIHLLYYHIMASIMVKIPYRTQSLIQPYWNGALKKSSTMYNISTEQQKCRE